MDLEREISLLGEEKVRKIADSHVALFGLGGVGSYCGEALVRAGIGKLTIIDGDCVAGSNINRQLFALESTMGMPKTEAAKKRFMDINKDAKIETGYFFYGKENCEAVDFTRFDYVADAIDSVTSKILIALKCKEAGVPLISSMGTGRKIHPEMLKIADIYDTRVCPLARVMRYELKKRGIEKLDVVYSEEKPIDTGEVIGSISFVPPVAGLMMAGHIIRKIAGV